MLRKIRITLAVVCFALITLLFLDFTGTLHGWFGWLAKVQFLPAVLALNVVVVVALVVLTLLLGRVYCSVICPLGVMQDVVSWLSGRRKKKKYRFAYSPAVSWLRYGVLAVFAAALVAGIGSLVALLAPYSAYGRMAQNLLAPLWGWGNNVLAYLAERADSYAFYETKVWIKSLPTFIVAAVSFIVIAVLAWRTDVLQYDLSGGHGVGIPCPVCVVPSGNRHGEMQRLHALFTPLQGIVHRCEGAPDRLQPLCGVHGLYRGMPSGSYPVCSSGQEDGCGSGQGPEGY